MATNKSKALNTLAKSPKQAELQLQEWPDRVRSVPNVILRSALFGISQVRAISPKRTLVASPDGVEIRFKGEHFNQDDLDVWDELVHRCRKHPLGTYVQFDIKDILLDLGLKTGGAQYNQFHETIARLQGGVIELRFPNEAQNFRGTLVGQSFYDETKESYVMMINSDLLKIYNTGASYIDPEERKLYKRNALAKWLHGFYTSHADPYAYSVATIRKLCGSKPDQRLGDFRKALRTALKLLEKNKSVVTAEIDEARDVVKVHKIGSASQRRHLEKKKSAVDSKIIEQNALDFDNPNS